MRSVTLEIEANDFPATRNYDTDYSRQENPRI